MAKPVGKITTAEELVAALREWLIEDGRIQDAGEAGTHTTGVELLNGRQFFIEVQDA